ncbi:tyrosine-type recombinase/integrase [Pseudomonas shirazensis]|uniref:tyrosine-type recombinase/integrase n=1 Tax=Pseudomonas shirazensis TaxID=2745494 RepID=UPI003D26F6C8
MDRNVSARPGKSPEAQVTKIERFQVLTPNYGSHQSTATSISSDINLESTSNEILYNFPILLDNQGQPWDIANLYLIHRYHHTLNYNHRTYASIADHLLDYRRFLDSEDIDYLHFPKLKQLKSTYRFKKHIEGEIDSGRMTLDTGKKRMSGIHRFYKNILKFKLIDPDLIVEAPYEEVIRYIETTTDFGLKTFITVSSSDLALQGSKALPDPDFIYDDGKTKPLTMQDQMVLLEALKKCDRAYQLLFYLAIFTGARLQTLSTIRICDLNRQLDYEGNLRLPVGAGTGIDTKKKARMTIIIPGWLVDELKIYIQCSVAQGRRESSYYGDSESNYIFLTSKGTPFYTSKQEMKERLTGDTTSTNFGQPYSHTEGEAVRQFLQTLIRDIQKTSPDFERFKFHDLRATFGMNLLEDELDRPDRKPITAILELVQQRMGHRNKEITLQYLNYRSRIEWKNHVQDQFESKLFSHVVRGRSE